MLAKHPLCIPDGIMNATDDVVSILTYSTSQRIVITVLLPILMIVGTLGNLAFIYVICRVQGMKTVTNACLLNLAIADILYIVCSMTKRLWRYTQSGNNRDVSPLGMPGCILFHFTNNTAYFAALFFITLVSYERFTGVCKPQKNRSTTSIPRGYKTVLVMCWILAMTFSMTFIPDHTRCTTTCVLWPNIDLAADFSPFWVLCSSHSPKFKIYSSLAQTLPFFIAFFVNIMLYVRIIHGLNLSFEKSTLVDKKDQNIRLRNQVAWMLIVNGSVFFLCLAPFEIISLLQGAIDIHTLMDAEGELYGLNSETLDIFGSIFKPFSYLNSVVNPVIYIAMSSRYREAFKSAFAPRVRRLRYRKSNQNGSPTSTVTTFLELCRERESKV